MEAKFKLIDGIFTAKDAREVIENLFDFKIQYHNTKSFGTEIRTGCKVELSLVRIETLKKTKAAFLHYIKDFSNTDVVELFSEIQIKK